MLDNNYLYIFGVLGLLLVFFVVYYFLQKRNEKQEHTCSNGTCNIVPEETYNTV